MIVFLKMATKVTVLDKDPNEIMEIVRELRSQGLVQGRDFDFAYQPSKYDSFSYVGEPRLTIFTFYTEKYSTLFALKYSQ